MLLKNKQLTGIWYSSYSIVILLAMGITLGSIQSISAGPIVGDAISTPCLRTNTVDFINPQADSTHNFCLWFYNGIFTLTSINDNLFNYNKNIFDVDWTSGNMKIYNQLGVNGVVTASGYSCSSDIRFKYNITPYTNAIGKIMSLNPVSYDWHVDKFKDRSFSKDRQIGFIAQDVEKVIPELVKTDEQGFKSVDYSKLSVVLVEAFKEQKRQSDAKILALEKENTSLKQRLASLEKMSDRIAKLESMMKQQKAVLTAR